jgi:hypothetical protein
MRLVVTSRTEVLEIQVVGKWRVERKTIQVATKSAIAALTATGGIYSIPYLHKMGILLGWW